MSLVTVYGFVGATAASSSSLLNPPSGSGTRRRVDIDPVEEKMIRGTRAARTASSTAMVPPTLMSQYRSGRATDSATSILRGEVQDAFEARLRGQDVGRHRGSRAL